MIAPRVVGRRAWQAEAKAVMKSVKRESLLMDMNTFMEALPRDMMFVGRASACARRRERRVCARV